MRSDFEKDLLKRIRMKELGDENQVLMNGEYYLRPPGLAQLNYAGNDSPLMQYLQQRDLESDGPERRQAAEERMIPFMRGLSKLLAGGYSLPLSGMELLGIVDEGTVKEFGENFETMLENKLPEQEGTVPMLVEGLTQYMIPGLGYYRLFGSLTKLKGFDKFLGAAFKGEKKQKVAKIGTRLFGAEFFTVMTAQNPTDPNFVGFLAELIGVDEEQSAFLSNEMINSIASPAEDWEAVSVFREKLEPVPGDFAIALAAEGVAPLLIAMVKTFRRIKRRGDEIERAVDEESIFPSEQIEQTATDMADDIFVPFEVPDNPFKTKEPVTLSTPMKDLIEGARQAEDARTWYTRHNKVIGELFGEDAQLFKELIGITSQQASVDENINRALKAYEYFKLNGSFKDLEFADKNELGLLKGVVGNLKRLDGSMPSKTGSTADQKGIRERMGQPPTKTSLGVETYFAGDKVPDFVEAMFEGTDEVVTIDRHMVQILFGEKSQIKPSTMAEGKRVVTQAANELGWTPKETQAAIWSFNQMKDSDIVQRKGVDIADVRDYKKAIEDRRDAITELLARFQ